MNDVTSVLELLRRKGNPRAIAGMARFGIRGKKMYGVSIPVLRAIGKTIGRNHSLAIRLWNSGVHEARILASLVADPARMTSARMDRWTAGFDSWDVCDQVCLNLFVHSPLAVKKALCYSSDKREFVKRAGFALMACLAVRDKDLPDNRFVSFFPLIRNASIDGRNYVRKGVNWALRQIGKRNRSLNARAISLAREIQKLDAPSARWIAADALRELESSPVKKRLKR